MKSESKFSPYNRKAFLATVREKDQAVALRLCKLLEGAFSAKEISIYSGFPVVVRDMEWTAGFAMRVKGPIAYCCSPEVIKKMKHEFAPFMSGKHCVHVAAKGSATVDDVLALVARAFIETSKHGGMICKADLKKREKLRALERARSTKRVKRSSGDRSRD